MSVVLARTSNTCTCLLLCVLILMRSGGLVGGDDGEDYYPPKVVISLVGEEPLTPPCTHHVDIELQSFDPADGYLELWVGGHVLRRVLDPPPAEIYPIYNSVYSCQPPMPSCHGSYTAKLFLFSSVTPVAESTVSWHLLPGATVPAAPVAPTTPMEGSGKRPAPVMSPELAREMWPLNCTMVQFPGFPASDAYLSRPLIVLAFPPHDLGWMHFDPAHVALTSPPALWLMSMSCPEAADVLVFSCGYSQGKMGLGAPKVSTLPHQVSN